MRVKNYKDFACMDYVQNKSCKDFRKLGQIVYRNEDDTEEIGVIIQVHENEHFRTDMFGNCHSDGIRLATVSEIKRIRHNLN